MVNGFKITEASDVMSKLSKYRDTYHDKGKYLGFDNINELYTMSLGNCTDWTGYPMSGKTQVLMEMLMNTSKFYGWKHLLYFPDVGSNVEIIADLMHKKTGKTFDNTKPNVINDKEIISSLDWILEHFKVLTKTEVKAKMTPFQFYDYAVELKKTQGLHTASIDSWKDLTHNYSEYGGYAQYLEVVLPYRNMIAEENDLHLHTIIHPKLTEKENGKRNPPTPYDLKGGSEWFNSGKCMVTIHRSDLSSNVCEFYANKIKPRSNGKIGWTTLYFDLSKFVYYNEEIINNVRITKYASAKEEKNEVINEIKPLTPNFEFDTKDMNEWNDAK
jgi:hypothetical protein